MVTVTHATQASGTDAGNGEIAKAQWNEAHTLSQATATILGRVSSGTGATEELTPTQVRTLADVYSVAGADAADAAWYAAAVAASGDVTAGSAFGTDNKILRSDGTGKGVQSSIVYLNDSGDIYGAASLTANYVGTLLIGLTDTGADNTGLFQLGTNLTGNRTYTLVVPDGDYSYTFPAANAAFASLNVEDQTATGGCRVTPKSLGNLSGTTISIDPGDRSIQSISNNGAGTIQPSASTGHGTFEVINTTGAGAVTTSSWTFVDGSFDTTTTSKFLCTYVITSNISVLSILKAA